MTAASRVDELALVLAAEAGDRAARAELVETFLPAIGSIARRYRGFAKAGGDQLWRRSALSWRPAGAVSGVSFRVCWAWR